MWRGSSVNSVRRARRVKARVSIYTVQAAASTHGRRVPNVHATNLSRRCAAVGAEFPCIGGAVASNRSVGGVGWDEEPTGLAGVAATCIARPTRGGIWCTGGLSPWQRSCAARAT